MCLKEAINVNVDTILFSYDTFRFQQWIIVD